MDVYEMQKVRQGSIGRRFLILCGVLCLLFVLMALRMSDASTPNHEEASFLWGFLAVLTTVFAVVVSAVKWLFTGRL